MVKLRQQYWDNTGRQRTSDLRCPMLPKMTGTFVRLRPVSPSPE